ncbi:MAG: hypothetical protein OEV49_15525 [candidate division Zixibacteria bacterium]|nr:hypothetical protein [candidate division Zixibacteria bacterium]MDH3938904.1 hypothetical protein [candidate division Zixibacteria bacterium]MDH4032755.1 hypothetical protein [candidate division Zixibacteria bacterium]
MNDTAANQPTRPVDRHPLTITLAGFYAFMFAGLFLLYGGVKVVLSFLDHSYDDLAQPIIFVIIGLGLLVPAFAFREYKRWGYWGLVCINAAVVILAAIGYEQYENLVLLVLSGAALYTLFAPSTREFLTKHR